MRKIAMVGEEVVKRSNYINALPEGAGANGSLKPNGNFEASPHLRRQLLTLAKVHGQFQDSTTLTTRLHH